MYGTKHVCEVKRVAKVRRPAVSIRGFPPARRGPLGRSPSGAAIGRAGGGGGYGASGRAGAGWQRGRLGRDDFRGGLVGGRTGGDRGLGCGGRRSRRDRLRRERRGGNRRGLRPPVVKRGRDSPIEVPCPELLDAGA